MHVLSADQFERDTLGALFEHASELREQLQDTAGRRELATRHIGEQVCSLFYEPSTRTRLSFETAAEKLGMGVISTENAEMFSSAAKGETLEDTIRVLDGYDYSAIVLRHKETGTADRAASVSNTPIINAGDGAGEHPTQSLLDVFTIYDQRGRLDNLNITIGGDLQNGRTARSLAKMLSKYNGNHLTLVSVPELEMGEDIKILLDESGTTYEETADMSEALRSADVVYWTRLQKERLNNPDAVPSGGFTIDQKALEIMPSDSIIMHPLPRVGEITPEVDADKRAVYFEQAENGLYIRMALLDSIASGNPY